MPTASIDFGNNLASGHEVLAGASPQAINVVVDGKGAVLRRPGISPYSVAPSTSIDTSGINGIHTTIDGTTYALSASSGPRVLYRISGGSSAAYAQTIGGDGRPVFTETEALLVFCTATTPYKVVKKSLVLSKLGGAPPSCTHITANSSRLLANDNVEDRTKVKYSNTAGGDTDFSGLEDWTVGVVGGPGFFTAEAKPDPVVAIAESTNDIFVFGSASLELYTPDSIIDFAITSVREYGLVAPYALVKVDQSFMWLDQRRRFVMSDGREFNDKIGLPIQASIDSMDKVDDCFAYRVHMDQIDCMVFTFPSEGVTFSYQSMAGWSQWQGWDTVSNNWRQHRVLSHHHRVDTDVNIVGTDDGVIAKYDMSVNTDLGELIPASVTTGFLDRETDHRKQCRAIHIAISRGTSTSATNEPVGFLSYADAPGQWRERIPLHLGMADDTNPVITLRSLGWYRRRQWKFEFSASERLALVSVKEDFEVLEP